MGKRSKHTNHWTPESLAKFQTTLANKKLAQATAKGQKNLFPPKFPPYAQYANCEQATEAVKKETVLAEAERIIYGDREKTYGNPSKNLTRIVDLWNMYLYGKKGIEFQLAERDVCLMMILLKVARDENKDNRDNLVDIVGYAALAQRIIDERAS